MPPGRTRIRPPTHRSTGLATRARSFPTRDNVYDGFFVDLAPGASLRLRGHAPVARYCSFVFYDRWFNTPDFTRHPCYRTLDEVEQTAGGTYELILGPDDPGHAKWIDTGGLRHGIFAIRCLLPQQRVLPVVEVLGGPDPGGRVGQAPDGPDDVASRGPGAQAGQRGDAWNFLATPGRRQRGGTASKVDSVTCLVSQLRTRFGRPPDPSDA